MRLAATHLSRAAEAATRFGVRLLRPTVVTDSAMRWVVVEDLPHPTGEGSESLQLRTLLVLFDERKQVEHLAFTELLSDETQSPSAIIDMLIDPRLGFAYLFDYSPTLSLDSIAQHARLNGGQLGSLVIACAALATRARRAGYCLSTLEAERMLIDVLGGVWLADSGRAHAFESPGALLREGKADAVERTMDAHSCCTWGMDPSSLLAMLAAVGQPDAVAALSSSVTETFDAAQHEDLLEVATHFISQVVSPAKMVLPTGLS